MGLYERHVCPHLTEWALDTPWVHARRAQLLAPIHGRVLELGFGTGANLRHYPDTVTELDVIDPSHGMHAKARDRVATVPFPIEAHIAQAEALPFESESFDAVVCTFTMCSVFDPVAALTEVRRVLRLGGPLYVFEHIASRRPRVRRWQDRLNPVQNVLGCGCNLNRETPELILAAGFDVGDVERIEEPHVPALFREHAFGVARKIAAPQGG